MTTIEGKNEILSFIEKKIEQTWKLLSLKYRKVKGKILFAHLFILNHKYTPSNTHDRPSEDPNWIRTMLRTLDELLRRGWTSVDLRMPQEEVTRFGRTDLLEFSELGKLQQLYSECRAFNVEKLEFSTDKGLSDATTILDSAFEDWLKIPYSDEEWIKYADDSTNRTQHLVNAINEELMNKYNVTLEVLHEFGGNVGKEIRIRLQPEETKWVSLIGFREEHLIDRLYSLDTNIDVKTLIKELEYKPGDNWMRTPFVRLKDNSTQDSFFFPITYAFYPTNVFAGSWIYHIPMITRKSSALGIMCNEWGKRFERYVRNKLSEHHPSLKISPGTTKIAKSDYPDMLDCVGKSNIEIDVIAQSETKVYLISCKALDQFYGSKLLRTLLGTTYDEFQRKLLDDIANAGEIEQYADCIRLSREYLISEGLEDKKTIPILMTSDVRPLSLESVREWSIDSKLVSTIPDIQIMQSKEISGKPFD